MTTKSFLAGQMVHCTRTCIRPADSTVSVNPSTVKMAVTSPAGVSTALTPSVPAYNVDNSAFTVTADWTIPDNTVGGTWTITTDTSGGLVAAHQERVRVVARTLAVVP